MTCAMQVGIFIDDGGCKRRNPIQRHCDRPAAACHHGHHAFFGRPGRLHRDVLAIPVGKGVFVCANVVLAAFGII